MFGEDCGTVNSTHFKERILDVFPDLTAHTKDRNKVHLVLKYEIGGILSNSGKNIDSDACCLARAAHIVRREVLDVIHLIVNFRKAVRSILSPIVAYAARYDHEGPNNKV